VVDTLVADAPDLDTYPSTLESLYVGSGLRDFVLRIVLMDRWVEHVAIDRRDRSAGHAIYVLRGDGIAVNISNAVRGCWRVSRGGARAGATWAPGVNQPARFRGTYLLTVRRLSYCACRERVWDDAPPAHSFSSTLNPNGGGNVKRAVLGSLALRWLRRRRGVRRHSGHSS